MFTSLAAFAAAAALVLCLVVCGELFEKPDTLRHAALMMTDLDNLKKPINDTYGHDMGDKLLNAVAQRLQTCIRSRDCAFRIGGDEFAVVYRADLNETQRREKQAEPLIRQVLGGNVPGRGRVLNVLAHIPGGREQVRSVAQGGHIHGVHGELVLAHDIDRHMGEVEILQRDGADVPGVGNLYLVLVALAVRPRFCPIPCFSGHGLGEDVLLVKEHFQIPLHLVQGEHPLVKRRQDGQQHIGVMLDLVQKQADAACV